VNNTKSIKVVIYSISSVTLICGLFIVADYFTLFGTKIDVKLEFIEVRFRTLDADTGGLVLDVGVRCFKKNNKNACTRRDSHRLGIVSVHIPVRRVIKKSLLFEKSNELIKAKDPEIKIMLLHQNYNNQIKTMLLDEMYSNKVNEYIVKMKPLHWQYSGRSNDE